MKICIISAGDFPHVYPYVNYFKSNHEVLFIRFTPSKKIKINNDSDISVVPLKFGHRWSRLFYLHNIIKCRKIVKKFNPDIVYGLYMTSAGLLTALSGKYKKMVRACGSDVVNAKSKIPKKLLLKFVAFQMDSIHVVSKDQKQILSSINIPEDKIFISNLGINMEGFSHKFKKSIQNGNIRMISIRRLEKIYNHETILEAMPLLKQNGVKIQLTFAGEGPLKNKLINLSKKLGLELDKEVKFIGHVENHIILEILMQHDIYLSASLYDGTSVSLMEAMNAGVFPIVSNIRANQAWIQPGVNGLLHEVKNPQDLANKITDYIKSKMMYADFQIYNLNLIKNYCNRPVNMKKVEEKMFNTLS